MYFKPFSSYCTIFCELLIWFNLFAFSFIFVHFRTIISRVNYHIYITVCILALFTNRKYSEKIKTSELLFRGFYVDNGFNHILIFTIYILYYIFFGLSTVLENKKFMDIIAFWFSYPISFVLSTASDKQKAA